MEQRLSIITLGVADLQQSRRFYESLGWKVATEEGAENIVGFNLQGFVLCLYPKKGLAEDMGIPMDTMQQPSVPSFTLAYNVDCEQGVHLIIEQARKIGAQIVKEPQKVFWGGYSSYFADPDGHMWEVAFNPYSTPKKDGSFAWK